jgi:hypothetical protein
MSAWILPMRRIAQKDGDHISEEDMDFYIRTCPGGNPTLEGNPRIDTIEKHLLICEQCRNGLQELDDLRKALAGVVV